LVVEADSRQDSSRTTEYLVESAEREYGRPQTQKHGTMVALQREDELVTLKWNSDEPMNLRATQLELSPPQAPSTRFLYPSGARPLEGYTIKRGVGHGGFGEVYYAVSDAGKEVALKLIRRNLDIEIRGVTQCLNLKHPNLLSIYDIRQAEQDENWVIMEYVQGDCLDDVIARHPNGMPLDQVLHWFSGMAAGVAYLHDHGVVHRDLKPGNIFLDEGMVKIGDYGLSKFISCSRRSGQTGSVGTVHYMAPEVANGRYGKEIDIYALGIILYEMLTGHVPFEGESIGEVLMKHLTAEADVSRLAEPYRTVVARALAKSPEVRFHTVGDMIAMMPRASAHAHYAAPERPTPRPSPSFPQRPEAHAPAPETRAKHSSAVDPNFLNDEPVARAIRTAVAHIKHVYHNATSPGTGARVVLNIVLVVMAIFTVHIWATLLAVGSLMYVMYIGVRAIVISFKEPSRTHRHASSPPATGASPSPPVHAVVLTEATSPPPAPAESRHLAATLPGERQPSRWRRSKLAPVVQLGTPQERATHLLGSLVLSSIVALVVSLVMVVVRAGRVEINQYMWLACSATVGAWAVLIPGKIWEGRQGDPIIRRFVFLIIGLAVGAAAYALFAGMLVRLPNEVDWDLNRPHRSLEQLYDSQGSPLLMAFMTYFGFLFLVPRWWRQTDPLRRVRLSLFFTAVVGFWAWVLHQFWPFPQPWGVMLAITISIAVQLSSRWILPQERTIKHVTA
jgi:serine/threonine protein kinase